MKKVLLKAISVILAVAMLLPLNLAFSFAETKDETPVFAVSKASETETELILMLSLKSGSFECFDAAVTVDGLTCKYIITTDTFDAYEKAAKMNGAQSVNSANPSNGKISLSITSGVTAPMDIATFAFNKIKADGINGSEVSFKMISCYVGNPDGEEPIEVTESTGTEITLPAKHVHVSDNKWVETKAVSCTEDGEKVTYCTECGKIASTEVIKATGHSNTYEKNRVDATCLKDGSVEIYCGVCKELIETKILKAKGSHGETYEKNRVEATCTKDGSVEIYCKDCDELLETKVLSKTGHGETYEKNRVEATCTKDGSVEIYCSVCKELVETKVLKAKGSHGEAKEIRKNATCTEDGYVKIVCPDCGEELVETVILKKTGHNIITDKKTATCTEDGYITHRCDKCDYVQDTTVIKAQGHKYVTDEKKATCEEAGYTREICTGCGDVKSYKTLPQLSHEWTSWSTIKEPTYRTYGISRRSCKHCGLFEEKEIPMVAVKATDISMSMDSFSMNYKQSSRLYANVVPEEATFSTEINWKSSNTKVCTVDENGTVYAAGQGTAVITASTPDGKLSSQCTVTVTYSWLQWIIVYILFGWIWY